MEVAGRLERPLISLRIDDRHSGKANIPPSALSFNLKQFWGICGHSIEQPKEGNHNMYVIIHTFQTNLGSKGTTISVRKTIPIELYDENTLSVVVFTKVQAAVDYLNMLRDNSKLSYGKYTELLNTLEKETEQYLCRK